LTSVAEALTRATGRRKQAVCRARLLEGSGKWEINGRPIEDYFPSATHRMIISEPLKLTNTDGRYDIIARIEGGGISGQAGALRHAISKALAELDPDLRVGLKKAGFLTRDAREKERRKYGLKKARKAPQYSKR
jgi:small subunit ribosomal protein S9